MEDQNSEFSGNLQRIANREYAGQALSKGASLVEAAHSARDKSQLKNNAEDIRILADELIKIEPKRFEVAVNLQKKLAEKFPDVPGITVVPGGSAVRGGGIVREMLENELDKVTDLDWAMTADIDVSRDTRKAISDYAREQIPLIAHELNLPGMIGSSYINSENFFAKNIESVDEAKKILLDKFNDQEFEWDPWTDETVIYLSASTPAETNDKNRKLILEALGEISIEDHDVWKWVTDNILDSYKQLFQIKQKHLDTQYANKPKDEELKRSVRESGKEVLMEKLRRTILETDKSVLQKSTS